MKVLIVDESTVSFGNMSNLVERLGIEVVGNATTEKEIEKTIIHHKPELILIDTRCSYLHGADTIRKIKRLNPETNVVVVSVFDSQQSVKQLFSTGISDIITKPIEQERFVESLRKLGLMPKENEENQVAETGQLEDAEAAEEEAENPSPTAEKMEKEAV